MEQTTNKTQNFERKAGVLLPVFSLPSAEGIGTLGKGAYEFVDFLAGAGMSLSDFEFFSAVVGAGSFTGIRIGVSAAKGFCLACEKPSIPVTSFELSAYNAVEPCDKILCIVDALHDAYYACGFDGD